MDHKKIRGIGAGVVLAVWLAVTVFAWFAPAKEASAAERRPLEQMPTLTWENLLNTDFMKDFESYTLDQFPLRDGFRTLKALFHNYGLLQKDNNGIYIADGFAAKLDHTLNDAAVSGAADRFNRLYETYLKDSDCNIFVSVVPDKGYYLAQSNGYPTLDYGKLFSQVQENMPWAEYIDITVSLSAQDYYFTDTHWRQERLIPVAQKLAQAMGVNLPKLEDFTVSALERPFYGVYYGQAALPMPSETMYILNSDVLDGCVVSGYDTMGRPTTMQVYNDSDLQSADLYDIFLSGVEGYLTVENPAAETDRELVIFRDSFGSSLAPLLVSSYAKITLVDIRYMQMNMLQRLMEFDNQDVLFLYSTLVLNNPDAFQTA